MKLSLKDQEELISIEKMFAVPWNGESGECWPCNCRRRGGQYTNGPCRCTSEWRYFRRRRKDLLDLAEDCGNNS